MNMKLKHGTWNIMTYDLLQSLMVLIENSDIVMTNVDSMQPYVYVNIV